MNEQDLCKVSAIVSSFYVVLNLQLHFPRRSSQSSLSSQAGNLDVRLIRYSSVFNYTNKIELECKMANLSEHPPFLGRYIADIR